MKIIGMSNNLVRNCIWSLIEKIKSKRETDQLFQSDYSFYGHLSITYYYFEEEK